MTEELSAGEAARVLDELGGYEETVSTKMMGVTWMIWGIAIPGIFLTYGTGASWASQAGLGWLSAVFWVPWIAAAAFATRSLWRTLALAFSWDEEDASWITTVVYTGVFFFLAGGLWFTGLIQETNMLMLATTGLLTMLLGLFEPGDGIGLKKPTLLAGAFLVVTAIVLDVTWASTLAGSGLAAPSLTAAFAVFVAYFGLAAYHLARG